MTGWTHFFIGGLCVSALWSAAEGRWWVTSYCLAIILLSTAALTTPASWGLAP
jgi:hypothetical protein